LYLLLVSERDYIFAERQTVFEHGLIGIFVELQRAPGYGRFFNIFACLNWELEVLEDDSYEIFGRGRGIVI
jgi:hypothetical protein